jgi:hypothetical protein
VVDVDGAGGDGGDAEVAGELPECGIATGVSAFVRPLELDVEALTTEGRCHTGGSVRVRDGEAAGFQMVAEAESDGVERLVEVVQGDAWSGGNAPPGDMLDLYQVTCVARECPALAVTADDIVSIRDRIGELDLQWQALAIGESMSLRL